MKKGYPPTRALRGLSEDEARTRIAAEGYNELSRSERRTVFRIILDVLHEPMFALLLGGGVVYLVLGDFKEAIVLVAFAMMSIVITIVQETRTERVLEALRDLTSPRALVIRDGKRRRIPGREVARGDLVILTEGDRVPADGVLLEAQDVQVDESLLTGESIPVRKVASDATLERNVRPGGDDLPWVFSGSLIVRGTGTAEVTGTGASSEIGKLGQSLRNLDVEAPRLRQQTARLVRLAALAGAAVSLLAIILYGVTRGAWLEALLAGIAIGMSMLPEEFPVVLTVFMAMGAWRIAQARVLARRAAAIETLGSATVFCTDKTGTLTKNRMTVVELHLPNGESCRTAGVPIVIPEEFHMLIKFGALASAVEAFDPMERAFHDLRQKIAPSLDRPIRTLERTYGLRPDLLAMTQVWKSDGNIQEVLIATKGAPEIVAELCKLNAADFASVQQTINLMAEKGLRVLGVAKGSLAEKGLPESQREFNFEFLGLVGLEDPLRESVPDAVRQCRSAGIKVIMITGDYPVTARAIARQIGLESQEILTGNDLQRLNDDELAAQVHKTAVFARIMPEQKLRIVNTLKANNEIVAMTGDGVNDALSLKAAHIGIAMGGRGTDVAREASALVLLDDDFSSVVTAIRLGRRIYDNLRKALGFIFSVHVPIAGLALLPLPFGLPLILGPMHIAFLEMVIDPICSLVFEAENEEEDVMNRPPRRPDEPLFSWPLIAWSLAQGTLVFAAVSVIFLMAFHRGMPEDEVRALTFLSLTVSIVSLTLVNRSFSASLITALRRPNIVLGYVGMILIVILAVILYWPFAGSLLRFGPLHADDLLLTCVMGFLILVVLELLKPFWRARLST